MKPVVSCLPQPAADYAVYPAGHAKAGQLRGLDFAFLLLAILAVQILVFLYTRNRSK